MKDIYFDNLTGNKLWTINKHFLLQNHDEYFTFVKDFLIQKKA